MVGSIAQQCLMILPNKTPPTTEDVNRSVNLRSLTTVDPAFQRRRRPATLTSIAPFLSRTSRLSAARRVLPTPRLPVSRTVSTVLRLMPRLRRAAAPIRQDLSCQATVVALLITRPSDLAITASNQAKTTAAFLCWRAVGDGRRLVHSRWSAWASPTSTTSGVSAKASFPTNQK